GIKQFDVLDIDKSLSQEERNKLDTPFDRDVKTLSSRLLLNVRNEIHQSLPFSVTVITQCDTIESFKKSSTIYDIARSLSYYGDYSSFLVVEFKDEVLTIKADLSR